MSKLRTNKQIYHSARIPFESVNYYLVLDKNKLKEGEYLKLANYLQPESIIIENDVIKFYRVRQTKELKLIQNKGLH